MSESDPGKRCTEGLTVDVHRWGRLRRDRPILHVRCPARGSLPCAPYLSNFLELNIRTYVHDEAR